MEHSPPDNKKEQLFEELIEIKLLYGAKAKALKNIRIHSGDFRTLESELKGLKEKISRIEKAISKYGEHFLDVYDARLINPLSESDIIVLRDEISEIRRSLRAINH